MNGFLWKALQSHGVEVLDRFSTAEMISLAKQSQQDELMDLLQLNNQQTTSVEDLLDRYKDDVDSDHSSANYASDDPHENSGQRKKLSIRKKSRNFKHSKNNIAQEKDADFSHLEIPNWKIKKHSPIMFEMVKY